jgi:ABC-type nitrate/sulfonate/bicarbonate transport system substrate-binding protein
MSDIQSINMDVTSALTAFKGGEADGLAVWNAIAFAAEDAGFVRVADAGSLDVVSLCGLVATPDALANKKDLLTKAWQVYYMTWNWAKSSDENMKKAEAYFYESCQEEGVASSEEIAKKSLALYRAPSPKDAIAVMTETEPDYTGKYTTRQLLKSENGLLQTLDFFIGQDKYKDADRLRLLDGKLVDSSIAEAAKADFAAQGIELK